MSNFPKDKKKKLNNKILQITGFSFRNLVTGE